MWPSACVGSKWMDMVEFCVCKFIAELIRIESSGKLEEICLELKEALQRCECCLENRLPRLLCICIRMRLKAVAKVQNPNGFFNKTSYCLRLWGVFKAILNRTFSPFFFSIIYDYAIALGAKLAN